MADLTNDDHYQECPAAQSETKPCHCEGINREEEAYREEPPEMFAREWGSY